MTSTASQIFHISIYFIVVLTVGGGVGFIINIWFGPRVEKPVKGINRKRAEAVRGSK